MGDMRLRPTAPLASAGCGTGCQSIRTFAFDLLRRIGGHIAPELIGDLAAAEIALAQNAARVGADCRDAARPRTLHLTGSNSHALGLFAPIRGIKRCQRFHARFRRFIQPNLRFRKICTQFWVAE
jgi:hypothetical protein